MRRIDGISIVQAVALLAYVVWTLVCSFVLGGGADALIFFGVWGGVCVGFSLFWRWADTTRRGLLRRRGYY